MIRIFIVLIMSRVLRVQGLATIKGAVQAIEAFAKWLVEMLHKCPVELCDLLVDFVKKYFGKFKF